MAKAPLRRVVLLKSENNVKSSKCRTGPVSVRVRELPSIFKPVLYSDAHLTLGKREPPAVLHEPNPPHIVAKAVLPHCSALHLRLMSSGSVSSFR